jgi:serine/threonine-protein kinase
MSAEVGGYKTIEKIGEGGMGEVYRGLDTMLEREVAIKQLRAEFASRADVAERFRTEAITLAKLSHPNIVTLHTFVRDDSGLYMVLEFVRGETLDAMIRRCGALPWPEAVGFVIQALRGLDHAHGMQVIHRDLKPANAMITPTGVLKLMDFGIARILNTARMTRVGHMIGTLQYMSPEQVKGLEGDARSDLYSLGIVLYELLTGRVPFEGGTDYELIRAQVETPPPPLETFGVVVPAALSEVLRRALDKSPEKRFQTAEAFRQALQTVLDPAGALVRDERTAAIATAEPIRRRRDPAAAGSWMPAGLRDGGRRLLRGLRPLASPLPAFVKANPVITAAILMVIIGLGLVFAARGAREPARPHDATVGRGAVGVNPAPQVGRDTAPREPAPTVANPTQEPSLPIVPAPSPAPAARGSAKATTRPPAGPPVSAPSEPTSSPSPPPTTREATTETQTPPRDSGPRYIGGAPAPAPSPTAPSPTPPPPPPPRSSSQSEWGIRR